MTPSDLDQRLAALRQQIAARPSMAPAVIRRTADIQMTPAASFQFRRLIVRASIGLAACAAIAIVTVTLLTSPSVAFSQVLEKVDHTKTLSCDLQQDNVKVHLVLKGSRVRMEMDNGLIYIIDTMTGDEITMNPKSKVAMKNRTRSQNSLDLYALLREYKDGKEERLGEKELAGHKVTGFKITRPMPQSARDRGETDETYTLTVWVDPASNLPVEVEDKLLGKAEHFTNLKFDQPIDDTYVSLDLPQGWHLEDQGKLSAPPTTQESQALVLIAGKGMGQLNLGDPIARVLEILGKPEHEVIYGSTKPTVPDTQPAAFYRHVMSYPSKGLEITLAKGATSDLVDSIRANSKASSGGSPINDFTGKTDSGIAIGATPDQIKAAYGEPTKISTPYGSFTLMEYDGINFSLVDEKVTAIAIIPPSQKK